MEKLLLLSVACIIFISCKEDKAPHTIAEGIIINSGTKEPIEGVKVYLYDGVGHSSGWFDLGSGKSKGSSQIDSTLTDSSGFFHLEIDGEEPVLYPFKLGYSFEYNIGGAAIGIIPLNAGDNKNLKFELDAWAYFKPAYIFGRSCTENDTTYFDVGDYVHKSSFGVYYLGKGPNKLYYYTGNVGWFSKGDKYQKYWLLYQVNGNWQTKIDSVYIKSFTTYTDTIYY